jgi:hypothetical protein
MSGFNEFDFFLQIGPNGLYFDNELGLTKEEMRVLVVEAMEDALASAYEQSFRNPVLPDLAERGMLLALGVDPDTLITII